MAFKQVTKAVFITLTIIVILSIVQEKRYAKKFTNNLQEPHLHSKKAGDIVHTSSNSELCPEERFLYVHDVNRTQEQPSSSSNNNNDRLIPPLFFQTAKSRCVHHEIVDVMMSWRDESRFPGWSYFLYDDDAMDAFIYDKERWEDTFPSLDLVLYCANVIQNPTLKADLWRLLVLWEYGGVYADMDTRAKAPMTGDIFQAEFDGFFFVENAGGYLAQFFLAVSPRHPLIYFTLNSALENVLKAKDLVHMELAMVSGPRALKYGVIRFLDDLEIGSKMENYKSYEGKDGRSFTVGGDIQEFLRPNGLGFTRKKNRIYEESGMKHYHEFGKGKERIGSCYGLTNATKTETGYISNGEEVKFLKVPDQKVKEDEKVIQQVEETIIHTSSNSELCPEERFLYVHDVNRTQEQPSSSSNNNNDRLIPPLFFQTAKSRCVHHEIVDVMMSWRDESRFPGWSYFLYDDDAMDAFIYDKERWEDTFPSLDLVLYCANVIQNPTLKADLWRLLVLWEYGGVYADMDTRAKAPMTGDIFQAEFDGFFFVENAGGYLAQFFLAVSPRHPLMYFTLNSALENVLKAKDLVHMNLAMVSGPRALKYGVIRFLDDLEIGSKMENYKSYEGKDGRSFTVGGDIQEFLRPNGLGFTRKKNRIYEESGMKHYHEFGKGKERIGSCYGLTNATKTETGYISNGEEVKFLKVPDQKVKEDEKVIQQVEETIIHTSSNSELCPEERFLYVHDVNRTQEQPSSSSNNNNDRLIPPLFFQTAKSRCVHHEIVDVMMSWRDESRFPGWSYFLYDDDAMDAFIYDKERWEDTFPSLDLVLYCANVIQNPTLKADLWRLLVLWEYGGVYADMDTRAKAPMTGDIFQAEFDGFFFVENAGGYLAQFFLAVSPRHPLIYFTLNSALENVLKAKDLVHMELAMVSGPRALKHGVDRFLKKWGIGGHMENYKSYEGKDGRSFTVGGDIQEFLRPNGLGFPRKKNRIYEESGMKHYHEFGKGKERIGSCYGLTNATKTETGYISNGEEVKFLEYPVEGA